MAKEKETAAREERVSMNIALSPEDKKFLTSIFLVKDLNT